jgi:AdoMet-dependent rRNA methyltransferase SPB1
MPTDSLIIGVDLSPIKPIPKVITFQNDITTESCRNTIRQHLKTWKADTVLHDGAPNVGTAWIQDSYNQAELALEALRLATDFLVEGGVFVSKVFRSKDYNSFLYICNQLFDKVEATKPPSSRDVSAEIFVVCRGFKAPKRIDPRFLDARSVFAELTAPTPNNEAKVYNPETKKRKREGYDEGDYTQFKAVVASEFINTTDPIAILANYNQLTFDQPLNGDVALAALDRLPQTSDEIRQSCRDLKILGRKEFKHLLRWRLRVREIFGLSAKSASLAKEGSPEEEVVVESLDEELRVQEELKVLEEKESAKKKRARRRENERKQKEIVRMQMNMTAPMDIGIEQIGPTGEASMFALKGVDDKNALNNIARGKMVVMKDRPSHADFDIGIDPPVDTDNEDDDVDDDDGDRLEANLDNLYDTWKERKAEVDNKYRAKRARRENVDEEWEGLSVTDQDDSDGSMNFDDDSSDAESDITPPRRAVTDLAGDQGLSGKARAYFDQDIFQDIPGLDYLPKEASISAPGSSTAASVNTKSDNVGVSHKSQSRQNEGTFGVVGTSADADDDSDWEDEPKRSMGEHFSKSSTLNFSGQLYSCV